MSVTRALDFGCEIYTFIGYCVQKPLEAARRETGFMAPGLDPLIRLGVHDSVAVARIDIAAGQPFGDGSLHTNQGIPRGHKVAVVDIPAGAVVIKYGQPIGIASSAIHAGDHVHLHNLAMRESQARHEFCSSYLPVQGIPTSERKQFLGYLLQKNSRSSSMGLTRTSISISKSIRSFR